MEVYRITLRKYANELYSPGFAARWNSEGVYVIYSAGSISLATLENIAHRSMVFEKDIFSVMVIQIPDEVEIGTIDRDYMEEGWDGTDDSAYEICRYHGDQFVNERKYAVLRVPSAIVPQEYNYLINIDHPDSKNIKISRTEPFLFDPRILPSVGLEFEDEPPV